ncbi:hypothetical protein BCIN_09g01780 [Botrytis cinerea B05.10]|uniref:MYND-type domain-containing protein n=2 Tax=Botryotinia fuckeliana TaxID=40559 RepID=A0A384JRU0_BOTFB|nr:hypothetical protein BCIN_09g01780 [Botrytis cinerea B05.10]ATZ53306.1 hypothetical protein BCIN_09g01780 [Botrytis cinerea B05.10]CCD55160.1 hypothetical protein BofuT4_P159810.1 [Botrytis cinerea T4]
MSPDFPNLLSPAFLTFSTCPLNPTADPSSTASPNQTAPGEARKTYLLATISQNMTLSTTPTFICTDSASASFALTIILESPLTPAQLEGSVNGNSGGDGHDFDIKKLKKGHTVVVPNPRRHGVREGKQGYVRCVWGDLTIIPASLDKLLGMSERFIKARESIEENSRGDLVICHSCERKDSEEQLSRCKGCSEVWYCGKECQIKGWNEQGHKSECKVLKTVCNMDLND